MRRLLAALALSVLIPLPAAAGEVTVESGDTLSEIAERNGVSVRELMRLNGIEDADLLEVGRRLRLPGGSSPPPGDGQVTVKAGETLSEIAERHGLSVQRLKELNGLKDANLLKAGQTLRLKGTAAAATTATATGRQTPPSYTYSRGAAEHVVRKGESLTAIAKGHDIPLERLVSLNGIEDPNLVKVGQTLRLKGEPAPAKAAAAAPKPPSQTPAVAKATTTTAWRTYGPLRVDWGSWQPMGGSMVAPSLNEAGQPIYLAINCGARKMNATASDGNWQTWEDPRADFEVKLMSDFCSTQEQ